MMMFLFCLGVRCIASSGGFGVFQRDVVRKVSYLFALALNASVLSTILLYNIDGSFVCYLGT